MAAEQRAQVNRDYDYIACGKKSWLRQKNLRG